MSEDLGNWRVACENIHVGWGTMDAFGHVNNAVYLTWFETARIEYFGRIGIPRRIENGRPVGVGPILARTTIDFRLPLTFPDHVSAEATVTKIGNSSFVMGYRVRSRAHDGAIAAEGEGVIVLIDYTTGAKVAVDDALREAIRRTESPAGG